MTIRRRRSPDVPMLRRYLDRGLTHRQIAVEWERETGVRVSVSAISAACSRAGLTRPTSDLRQGAVWLVCRICGSAVPVPELMPAERDEWMAAHERQTGHDSWEPRVNVGG